MRPLQWPVDETHQQSQERAKMPEFWVARFMNRFLSQTNKRGDSPMKTTPKRAARGFVRLWSGSCLFVYGNYNRTRKTL